jgi:hypothetical protein
MSLLTMGALPLYLEAKAGVDSVLLTALVKTAQ